MLLFFRNLNDQMFSTCVLGRVSVAVERHSNHGHKDKHLGLAYTFRGSLHCHGGGIQEDMVLKKEQRILCLDAKAVEGHCESLQV